MVINNYKGGQLANRIISFAHLAANSMAHGYKLYNTEFDEFCPYFEATSKNKFLSYPISITVFNNRFTDKVILKLFRFWTDITHLLFTATPFYRLYRIFKSHDKKHLAFDLNDPSFVKDATSKRVITQGWGFRDDANFFKYQDDIRNFFTPVELYRNKVADIMKAARSKADVIIGVHIRRGDYSRFEGGKYFYSDEVYADKMMQVENKFSKHGKRCLFLICSNDQINLTNFPSLLNIEFSPRHFITDLYCLAATDGIIGPPSTFSLWAAFYGKVPLSPIYSKDDLIEIGEYVHRC